MLESVYFFTSWLESYAVSQIILEIIFVRQETSYWLKSYWHVTDLSRRRRCFITASATRSQDLNSNEKVWSTFLKLRDQSKDKQEKDDGIKTRNQGEKSLAFQVHQIQIQKLLFTLFQIFQRVYFYIESFDDESRITKVINFFNMKMIDMNNRINNMSNNIKWAWNNERQKIAWIKNYTLRFFLWVCFDDESFSRFIAMKRSLTCKQNSNFEILSRVRSRIKSNSSTEDRELWSIYLSRNERELLGVS